MLDCKGGLGEVNEDDIRRDEQIRQEERDRYQFVGCLKVFGLILVVSLAMSLCGLVFCT